jgi:hypothetical protein
MQNKIYACIDSTKQCPQIAPTKQKTIVMQNETLVFLKLSITHHYETTQNPKISRPLQIRYKQVLSRLGTVFAI